MATVGSSSLLVSCLLCRGVELGWSRGVCSRGGDRQGLCPASFTGVAEWLFHPARLAHFGAGGFVRLEIAFSN